MSRRRDNWRMYGAALAAAALFVVAIAEYIHLGQWEKLAVPMAGAAFGFACAAASEEVSDWIGQYR